MSSFILKVYRGTTHHQYFEEFELLLEPRMNIISALMHIQKSPINRSGKRVAPVVWEQGCLEEVCGSCSMLINGVPRQACSAIVQTIIKQTGSRIISLAPFSKFKLVRDLVVSRQKMFEDLKRVKGWIESDGTTSTASTPPISPRMQAMQYTLSTCMTCGCCSQACPQVSQSSSFIGPAPISQVRLFNSHPTGKFSRAERLHTLMDKGGVSECGNAQNCVQVCPKNIPLTESIAAMNKEVVKQSLADFFSLPDQEKK